MQRAAKERIVSVYLLHVRAEMKRSRLAGPPFSRTLAASKQAQVKSPNLPTRHLFFLTLTVHAQPTPSRVSCVLLPDTVLADIPCALGKASSQGCRLRHFRAHPHWSS